MIDYVGLILFALVLIEMLITKEAGFLGMNVKKKDSPKDYYAYVFLPILVMIFFLLRIFGVFE